MLNWDAALPFVIGLVAFWVGTLLQAQRVRSILRRNRPAKTLGKDWEQAEGDIALASDKVQGIVASLTVGGSLVVSAPSIDIGIIRSAGILTAILCAAFWFVPNDTAHLVLWGRVRARRLPNAEITYMAMGATVVFVGGFLVALFILPVPGFEAHGQIEPPTSSAVTPSH